MNRMKQAHFFSLPTQGNIYTITNLHLSNNTNKVLIASLKRQVFCFEYIENSSGLLIPTTKEISFTYIPSGAEIISIDAFNKSEDKNDFVIGITIIKNSIDNTALETYLNIYSEWEESKELNIESIAQNCLNVELNFTPYQLTHTFLITQENHKEIVFILSGSDNHLHIFRESKENHSFKEIDAKDIFPEFENPPSVVLWVDVYYYLNYSRRISGFGCECGYLRLVNVCCKTNTILYNFSTQFISSISHIQIFPNSSGVERPSFIENYIKGESDGNDSELNLVVVNSILPAVLFKDIINCGLKHYTTLRRTEMISVSTCFTSADIDFDGEKELLVGNSAEYLMAYKIVDGNAKMVELKKIVSPIFFMQYVDLSGDGVKELLVFTMKGMYVLQHDPKYVQKMIEDKITKLTIPDLDKLELME